LISGRGSNMAALIEAAKAKDFPAEIAVVISNRAEAGGLDRAKASGIATEIIESKPFGKDRAAFEKVLEEKLRLHRVELICLGGDVAACERKAQARGRTLQDRRRRGKRSAPDLAAGAVAVSKRNPPARPGGSS